jgi:hypothetical protein
MGLWSLLAGKHRSGEHSPTDLHKGCAQRGVAGPMPAALSGAMRRGTPPIAAKVCVCAPSSRQAQRPGRLHSRLMSVLESSAKVTNLKVLLGSSGNWASPTKLTVPSPAAS